ncbi:hypothetical protein AAFF_G00265610 [Aldrovandia affinis]|uniref:Sema domain-containing protein n=1 Tax=Aldrovandia affinis TaxID=143900 RepID=A0AAD7RBR3_9TELE|nr:hypothetical protein AAFF_G00265610 [Aldrovandia affinis]
MYAFIFIAFLIGHSRPDENNTFDGNISNFAVLKRAVYVVANDKLYQMSRNLTVERRKDVSNATNPNVVKILVPFENNNTLITCGTHVCGYCQVLDLDDISKTIYEEPINIASLDPNDSSIVFLINIGQDEQNWASNTYLLAGAKQRPTELQKNCGMDDCLVALRNTKHLQDGYIFSKVGSQGEVFIKTRIDHLEVEFVDGFQRDEYIYVFLNLITRGARLLLMKRGETKADTLESFRGVTLECCGDKLRPTLVSSAVATGSSPILWAGVFRGGNRRDSENTALAIFTIAASAGVSGEEDPEFCFLRSCSAKTNNPKPLAIKPKSVVYKYQSMTSVATVTVGSWLVFFIGTADGQLIKVSVDKAMNPTCPIVLYESDKDRPVHSKMILDPVDEKHIYLVLGNQMIRMTVAQCWRHGTVGDCWSAQDPSCGWCAAESKCTFHDECSGSTWISIPDGSVQERMVSFRVEHTPSNEEIKVNVMAHLSVRPPPAFSCAFTTEHGESLCVRPGYTPPFLNCSCIFSGDKLPEGGLRVTVTISLDNEKLDESLNLKNCSVFAGNATASLCSECITSGCLWSFTQHTCSWMSSTSHQNHAQDCQDYLNILEPEIYTINPKEISFYGKNNAKITGKNLEHVTKIRIRINMDCILREVPIQSRSNDSLTVHIPGGSKGAMTLCAVVPGGKCYGSAKVIYKSPPSCTGLLPKTSWASGGRLVTISGQNLELVDSIEHVGLNQMLGANFSSLRLHYSAPRTEVKTERDVTVRIKVANETIRCGSLTYQPDPEFTGFSVTPTGDNLRVTIVKKVDKLNIAKEELNVYGVEGDVEYKCELVDIETSTVSGVDSLVCEIRNQPNAKIELVKIHLGNHIIEVEGPHNLSYLVLLIFLVIPLIIVGVVCIYRVKQRKMSEQMNERLELLECDIRTEIRQGFVDMQIQRSDLTESVGAIPFLDYKHFASRTFFPDGTVTSGFLKDLDQNSVSVSADQSCQALSRLLRDQLFLTSFVHALEGQKTFKIKDKCNVASLLTLALHGDLPYLTEVMEELLQALMDQSSNAQPKLMLRRTESIVEKLLTNWMSICLYGFLRESVGQPLFLLVSALNQQISKGPVDSVTEKALYTLSEDWLLWQAQDFTTLKLQVSFEVVSMGEGSTPLDVSVLDCDTVEQVKEKILVAFKSKFGNPYSGELRNIDIEYEKAGSSVLLQEVDASSQVLGDVTMLNTLRHYKVPDGASIKVITKKAPARLSTQTSLKDDTNYSIKYFHLIDPDIDRNQGKNPARKKLKLKEVYLPKLLFTKVAVHSFTENLFRTIWGTSNNRVPFAIKHFFDFLDAQWERKKISDPDVLHIWKTNSLPLRFWINILKNPQFVFDMEKTPHLDGCLSVIAQAFMDSFSLAEQQLDKHAPTNKLLYAKDTPQYKQEVKAYYKQVKDTPAHSTSEFKAFLQEESKKHENEFNEAAALQEIYKYLQQYLKVVQEKLELNGASSELKEKLQEVMDLFTRQKSCSWD